jgi:hypothetical protein
MVALSSLAGAGWQFFGNNGLPLAGGKLFTYAAGTTTPLATYTSSSGATPHANPIILDSAGRVPNEVWLTSSASYKFTLKTAANVEIWTKDNVPGISASSDLLAFITLLASTSGAAQIGTTAGNTIQDNLDNVISVMSVIPTAQYAAIRNGTTTYNATAVIQALIDNTSAAGGGEIQFPKGTFLVGDLVLKNGVVLSGAGRFGYGYLASTPTKKTILKMAAGATWVIDTVATDTRGIGVVGFDFVGLGAGTTNGGIRIRTGNRWGKITNCSFNTFGDQAILNEGSVWSLSDILVINTVLNRTRSQLTGAVEDKGFDTYLFHIEAGPSLTAGEGENGIVNITDLTIFTGDISTTSTTITNVSSMANVVLGYVVKHANIPVGARVVQIVSANSFAIDVLPTATTAGVTITPRRPDLYICGILLAGANCFCSDSNGEFSERGIHSESRFNTIVGCRGDRNAGHGISGSANWIGAKAGDNSYYASGLWDNFNFNNTQNGKLIGGAAYKAGAMTPSARYDLQCLGSWITSLRWLIPDFSPSGSATIAAISNDVVQPHDIRSTKFIGVSESVASVSGTPNVFGLEMYIPNDTVAATITNFLNGIPGQDLYVLGNSFITIQHNTSQIICPSFVDLPMVTGVLYHFKRDKLVWRFVGARPYQRQSAISSPTGGATIDTQARTAIDAIRTALAAVGITA